MAKIPMTRFEVYPAGMYRVRVYAVEMRDGDYGPQVAFTFALLDEGYENKMLFGWTTRKFTPGRRPSNLYRWASALFGGRALPDGMELDTDTLIGREALAVVEIEPKEDGEKNKIAQLLPIRAAARPAAPATRAAGSASPATRPANVTVPAAAAALTAAARPQPVRVNQGIAGPVDIPEWLGGAEDGDGDVPF